MRRQLAAAALLSTSFFFLTGFEKRSKVDTQSSVKGKTVELEFRVNLFPQTVISKDGEWKLLLTNIQGLKLETKDGTFETKAFDESLPGFKVKAEVDGAASAGQVDFTVKAFVCDDKKTRCFPQTHKGNLKWTKS